jgi:hypothetical protein
MGLFDDGADEQALTVHQEDSKRSEAAQSIKMDRKLGGAFGHS